ncbi:MAG: hypothetical protein GY845_13800, partial [Planctomycetes bacterium]|nr:hypothetical protein [Planctomycetota bacterium]
MISRKHNSGIAYILTVSMIWLILSALSDVALSAWQPPIGIPAPSFGINETFRYYDVAGNRASGLTYRASPNGGFYTHYVDMNHINATDADPYGTATAPRLTMPAANTVIAGSVVEVHGGPYAPTVTYTLDGTSALPIFIRGDGVDTDPEFTDDLAVSNSYSIWENLLVNGNGGAVKIRGGNGNACEYISIRNCAILGQNLTSPVQIGQQSTSNYETNNIVLYKNTIDNDGFNPPDA